MGFSLSHPNLRKEDRAEVSWRDVFFSLSSTALYYFVSHPPHCLSADTPILAEKLPVQGSRTETESLPKFLCYYLFVTGTTKEIFLT